MSNEAVNMSAKLYKVDILYIVCIRQHPGCAYPAVDQRPARIFGSISETGLPRSLVSVTEAAGY